MNVKQRTIRHGKLNLCLPEFSRDEMYEADIMNSFYEKLEDEICKFVSSTPNVRRYCTNFSVAEADGVIYVTLNLSARIIKDFGEIKLLRREIKTKWSNTKLEITETTQTK